MKKLFKISFVLLALVGVLFTSCKKDYPEPPIQVLPVGTIYTIADILAMESGTVFNEDASVYGVITADEKSGNLYKAAFMQDRASGKAIELYMNATSGLRIGDSIRVYLKDVTYSMYNGLPQLNNFEADGHIVILANEQYIEPTETTIANIIAGDHLAGLVKLNNVMFTEKNTFADPSTYGNRTLVDPTDFSKTVIVRTSNYANFANDSLPQGTGSLVAIASVYGTTWQLYIRSLSELKFEGYNPGGGGSTLPYYQDFASSFGTYSTYNVSGAEEWVIDYNTAKMTGFVNSTNNANEDWLISAPVSLENVTDVSLTMKYIARYFSNLNEDVTIQVSTDYTSGDPNQANWVDMHANLSEGSNWNDFLTAEVDLSRFAGQKVVVAVKYVSSEVKAGTIEVQSILIHEGGGVTPPNPPGPAGELQSMPYTQSFADEFGTYTTYDELGPQSWMIDYHTAKMTGYAGGSHANIDWLISSPVAVTGVDKAKVSVTYSAQYQNADASDITLRISTDYVFGGDPNAATWTLMSTTFPNTSSFNDFQTVETSLNDFIGQNVYVAIRYTSTDAQSRTIEVQSITVQEGEAGGGGVTPPTPPGPGGDVQNIPYTQSFATEFGSYMPYDVSGPQSWEIDYSTAKMTGYVNSVYNANEDWLISSPVNLAGVNEAKMTMSYIGRYFNNINEEVTIWASTDYTWGDNPTRASWRQISATLSEGSNWTTFLTAEISLVDVTGQSLAGQTVTIAVKYLSTNSKAGTMEIQSITIDEGSGVTPPTPPTPGDPQGSGTAEDPYNVAAGIINQGQENVWVQGYIVGAVRNGLSAVSSNDDVIWSGSFDSQTNVVIADDPTCNEVSLCVIVNLPAGRPLRTQVNLVDNPGNLGKMLAVKGKLRTYFGQAGLRDSNGTENDFVLEGGTPTPPPGQTIFSETFANGQGDFVIEDVLLPSELTYVWAHAPNYSCMKGSGYVGQAYETESWLVSPYIDLSNVNTATLKFEQAVNYLEPQGALSVLITTEYVDTVDGIEWEELQLSAWPAGNDWTFVNSTADLTPYAGQRVTIAFMYTSTPNGAATWEVKNFVVE